MGKKQPVNIFDKEKGFQLVNFFKEIRRKLLRIIGILIVFLVIGVIYALSQPNLYRSAVTFMPQATISPKLSGSLGSIAALAGVKLGGASGESSSLSPVIYPRIFESIDYKLELGDAKIVVEDGKSIFLKNYFYDRYNEPPSFLGKIKGWILPAKPKQKYFLGDSVQNINQLDSTQLFFIRVIQQYSEIEINQEEGYLQLSSTTESPAVSAQIAATASEILQNNILETQVKRANVQLDYLETRLEEQYEVYRKAQINLANYRDRNLYSSTQRASAQLSKLQSDYDLAFGVYLDLSQQAEAQRLQVKKDSPIFTILEKAIINNVKVGPNRLFIVVFFLILGLFLSFIYVTGRQYVRYLTQS